MAPTRLTADFLQDDLTVAGMFDDGQSLATVDLVYIEPFQGPMATLYYDPATGEIVIIPPDGRDFTSVNIDSAAAIFTGDPPMNVGGSDCCSDDNIFKATFGSSFGSLGFGNVAQAGVLC